MSTQIPPEITDPNVIDSRIGALKPTDGFPGGATTLTVYDNLDFQRGVQASLGSQSLHSKGTNMSVDATKRLMNRFLLVLLLTGTYAEAHAADISPAEAREIAKEAYIYGYPLVDNYRVEYSYFVDRKDAEFKAPWNQITNIPRVFTPKDTAVQTPNSDTPYSWLGLDLRTEPIVLTLPKMDRKDRYFSVQMTDAYTFNFAYLGTRTTGNDGGTFLVAGPNWKGAPPKGIQKVIRSETDFIVVVYRTQLFNPADLENVKKIQAGYLVQPLSAFAGVAAPPRAPAVDFIRPISANEQKTSLQFFSLMNFVLQFCPTVPSETTLRARFAEIGVAPGKSFEPSKLSPDMKAAIEQGRADAWGEFASGVQRMSAGTLTSGDLFGTRDAMKNNYLNRWLGTIGIYGNSKQEALYPIYYVDSAGEKLNGSHRYSLRFAPDQFPPVNAFWSLTMYELPSSLLVANPIDRYLINSPMLPQLKRDADGGVTLLIQNQSPGKDSESNWLPAPKGPFSMYMRLYWPKEAALQGQWAAPKAKRVD
jgi:hypothetical protein